MEKSVRRAFVTALALSLVSMTSAASANGRVTTAGITEVTQGDGTIVFFRVSKNVAGERPECMAEELRNAFAFDVSDARGRAYLSLLTAALLSGKNVDVAGAGACTAVGSGRAETLSYVKLRR